MESFVVFVILCKRLNPALLQELREKNIAVLFEHFIHTFRVVCSVNNLLLVKVTSREQGHEIGRYHIRGADLLEIWDKWREQGVSGHFDHGVRIRPCIQLEKNHDTVTGSSE